MLAGQPKALYYVPVQSSYDIGQTIECHADANPAASFFWQNMATNERWDDYRLYVNDPMIGSQTVWCHAQNQIGHNVFSADMFFNLTVNRELHRRAHYHSSRCLFRVLLLQTTREYRLWSECMNCHTNLY